MQPQTTYKSDQKTSFWNPPVKMNLSHYVVIDGTDVLPIAIYTDVWQTGGGVHTRHLCAVTGKVIPECTLSNLKANNALVEVAGPEAMNADYASIIRAAWEVTE